jgi:hypothetical protein
MQVKKEVIERVKGVLQKELDTIRYKISDNKNAFKKLRNEQIILKRERARLDQMIRDIA